LRHVINNDDLWWKLLLDYATTYKHKIIDTETVIAFFNKESKMDLTPIFNQYLRYTTIPDLLIRINKDKLEYRWNASEPNFNMPIGIKVNGKEIRIAPTPNWQTSKLKIKSLNEIELLSDKFYVDMIKE